MKMLSSFNAKIVYVSKQTSVLRHTPPLIIIRGMLAI